MNVVGDIAGNFLSSCPMYIKTDKFLFTHAPIDGKRTIEQASELGEGFAAHNHDSKSEFSLIWNRYVHNKPNPNLEGRINVFGHNSSDQVKIYCKQYPLGWKVTNDTFQDYLKEYGHGDIWAIAIDTSSAKVLTGLHTPTMTIYQQDYID